MNAVGARIGRSIIGFALAVFGPLDVIVDTGFAAPAAPGRTADARQPDE
jgi:hypothetical protein